MAQYICGVNAGTTGTKIMIFTVDGIPVSHAYKEYPCPGWVKQDP